MPKKKKKKEKPEFSTKAYPREPAELQPLGVFRKNLDYGEGPYFGVPQSIPEWRKKRERRLKRVKALKTILGLEKSAGMIEPPPILFKEITAWAHKIYCSYLLYLMDTSKNRSSFDQRIRDKCLSFGATPNNLFKNLKNRIKIFDFNMSGWKYNFKFDLNLQPKIRVILDNKPQVINKYNTYTGSWYPGKNLYELKINPDINEYILVYISNFNDFINNINDTIAHELIHPAQTYISTGMVGYDSEETFGLPSKHIRTNKIKNLEVDIYGEIASKSKRKKEIDHSLRDVEFYPLIYSEVIKIK